MPQPPSSAKRLKVGLVLDDTLDKPDGIQQYVLGIGEWLRAQGHDVHYLVGETVRTDVPGVHSLSRNLKVKFNGNGMSMPLPTSPRKLKAFMRHEKFDVIHVQTPYSPFLAHRLILAAGPETAVIGTFHIIAHNKLSYTATRALGIWSKKSLARFDSMVSVSEAAQVFAKKTYGVDSTVLPNVVDYDQFALAEPLPQYKHGDVLTVLFLGRLVPRKGCHLLLEALVMLDRRTDLPPFRVIICGKGPLRDQLERFSIRHGLSNIVRFIGFVSEEDKPRYYASADISVFPSLGGESFGIVLLEAMASGQSAVLAGNNPGYSSVLASRPELLFGIKNARSLRDKLARYLVDAQARQEASQWGQQFTAEFDTSKVGNRLLTIYEQALHKRRQP